MADYSFGELKNKPLDEIAEWRSKGQTGSAMSRRADAVLRLREVEAVVAAAEDSRRYAQYTFWVAVCTAATAFGTLLVAVFTALGG